MVCIGGVIIKEKIYILILQPNFINLLTVGKREREMHNY